MFEEDYTVFDSLLGPDTIEKQIPVIDLIAMRAVLKKYSKKQVLELIDNALLRTLD